MTSEFETISDAREDIVGELLELAIETAREILTDPEAKQELQATLAAEVFRTIGRTSSLDALEIQIEEMGLPELQHAASVVQARLQKLRS